jgi:hypothetical protein
MTIPRPRARRRRVAGLLAVIALLAAVGGQPWATSSPSLVSAPASEHRRPGRDLPGDRRVLFGEADGAVPGGTTVRDGEVPGVAKLDPGLLAALRRAASDAAGEGVELVVDSGWRSPAYQQQLLDEAISKYGSQEEAARWVARPERSAHVSGDAVDIAPAGAAAWLSRHGAAYGLCQVYGNEPWHFELRPEAPAEGCPAPYADPTHDPRLQP